MTDTSPAPIVPPSRRYRYKAFISYHHGSDVVLAKEIKKALQRLAKPFYRVRAFEVFLDQSSLGATSDGFHALQAALDESEFFILLASPGAAQSAWVAGELEHWFARRDDAAGKLLIVHTGGAVRRGAGSPDFDWEMTDALPKVLAGRLAETPIWVDMTWARASGSSAQDRERFQDGIATLASTLHGRSKDELSGEDAKQRRRSRLAIGGAATAFAALVAVLAYLSWRNMQEAALASANKALADTNQVLATANRLSFESESLRSVDIVSSAEKALEASRKSANDTTWSALLSSYYHMDGGWLLWRRNLGKESITTLSFSDTGDELLLAGPGSLRITGLAGSVKPVSLPSVTEIRGAFHRPGSPDQILVAHGRQASLWSLREGTLLWKMDEREAAVESVGWSGTGDRMLVTDRGGGVRVFSATSKQQIRSWDAGPAAALSFDGQWIALSSADNKVWIESVDLGATAKAAAKKDHPGEITRLSFSPDGEHLAVAFGHNGSRLWRRDGSELKHFRALDGHLQRLYSLRFSPDSSLLVSASDDGSAIVWRAHLPISDMTEWELARGRRPRSPLLKDLRHVSDPTTEEPLERGNSGSNRTNLVNFAAFSPGGDTVATALIDGSVALWFLGGDVASARRFPASIQQSAPVPGTSRVASAAADGHVYVWDTKAPGRSDLHVGSRAECVAPSPDGTRLVIGDDEGWLSSWRQDGAGRWTPAGKTRAHEGKVPSCVFSPDGKTILTTGLDGRILLWENPDEPVQLRALTHGGEARDVWTGQFSHDGKLVVAAGNLGKAYIFELSSGRASEIDARGRIAAASFDPTDRRVLTAAQTEGIFEVRLWSREGELLTQLQYPVGEDVGHAIFSRDGAWIISATMSGEVRIWDVSSPSLTGRVLLQWQAHSDWIMHLALSPSGDHLWTSAYDGTVREWPISVTEVQRLLAARIGAAPKKQ